MGRRPAAWGVRRLPKGESLSAQAAASGATRTTAWGQIVLLGIGGFAEAVGFCAILPYLPIYLKEQGGARVETIGIVAAAAFVGMALFAGPLGRASDRWGRKPFVVCGFGLSAVAVLLFLTTTHPVWFVLFRFLEGLGGGMAYPAVNALVGDLTTDATRSRAYGWITTAQFGGGILGPALAIALYEGVGGGLWGYRVLFIVGGICLAAVTAAAAIWLREPVRAEQGSGARGRRPLPLRSILTAPILAFFFIGATSAYCTGAFEVVWSLWLRHLGASMAFVGWTWIAFSIPMLLSFAGGWVADRGNRFLIMMIGFGISAVVWVLYGTTTNLTIFIALNALEGLSIAFAWPAREALLVKVSPPKLLGAVMGYEQTVIQSATALGTILAPVIYARDPGFSLSVGGLLMFVGLAVAGPVLGKESRRLKRAAAAEASQAAEAVAAKE